MVVIPSGAFEHTDTIENILNVARWTWILTSSLCSGAEFVLVGPICPAISRAFHDFGGSIIAGRTSTHTGAIAGGGHGVAESIGGGTIDSNRLHAGSGGVISKPSCTRRTTNIA